MTITLKQKMDLYKKVRANPDISCTDKVIFNYLLIDCLNCETLKCHPGRATIAKAVGCSLDKVKRALARLKKAGELAWESGREKWANEYRFPGLAVTVTEMELEGANLHQGGGMGAPREGERMHHQERMEDRREHSPSKDADASKDATPSLKGFDDVEEGRKEGRGFAMVSKGQNLVPSTNQVYVRDESPQRKAWDAHGRKNGRSYPKDKNGGWFFPTEWPPGFEKSAIQDNGSDVQPRLATRISEERRKP